MFTGLLSFLGGSAFRMVWGELSSWMNKRQDHEHEIERMKLEGDLADRAHQRQQDIIRLQAELGVKQIEVQRDADVSREEAQAFSFAMKDAFKKTGIAVVDIWNGIIRPQFAQIALVLWVYKVWNQKGVMDSFDMELAAGVLGFFIADRTLARRGK